MKRILVVDDEPHMTRVLKLYLERAGYAVKVCLHGQDALTAVLAGAPDAMITDIQMPLMTGKQLCLALEEQVPERKFPIFVMTSKTDREEREWTAAIRGLEFLEKPLSVRALVARLDRHFGAVSATAGASNA
jgi:DNA-binding response OmpR family regulator